MNYLRRVKGGYEAYCSTMQRWYTPTSYHIREGVLQCSCTLCDVERKPLRAGAKPQPHMYLVEDVHVEHT